MTNIKKTRKNDLISIDEKGFVSIPLNQSQFKDFIVGLLGKPQSIQKSFFGTFQIDINSIINIHELINQRIVQQNEATLIRLNSIISFDDYSNVSFESIDQLVSYNETKPIISTSITLNWQYLIKFLDKDIPEKQSIEITFETNPNNAKIRENISKEMWEDSGYIHFNIKHTARTWGADIENLLSNHLNKVIIPYPKINLFVKKYKKSLSDVIRYMFVISGMLVFTTKFSISLFRSDERLSKLDEFYDSLPPEVSLGRLSDEIRYTIERSIPKDETSLFQIFMPLGILFVLFLFGFIISSIIERNTFDKIPSFILLTENSKIDCKNKQKLQSKLLFKLIASLIIGVVSSLIASYLYYKFG